MSSSGIIDWTGNKKIYNDLLPNPYPYPAQANALAQVLIAGNDAGNQDAVNFNTIESTNVETALVHNPLLGGVLSVGSAGETIRILGATAKGSLLVGDGTDTKEYAVPSGSNGKVLTADSTAPLGVAWGPAGGSGSVQGVSAGVNIEISGTANVNPVVNLRNPLTSGLNIGGQNVTGTTGQVVLLDPAVTQSVLDNNHIRIDDIANGFYWNSNGASLEAKKPSFAPIACNWYDIVNSINNPHTDTLYEVLGAGNIATDKTMYLKVSGPDTSQTSMEPNSQNAIVGMYTDNGGGTNNKYMNFVVPVSGAGSFFTRPTIVSGANGSGDGLGFSIDGVESVIVDDTGLGGAVVNGTVTETSQLTTQTTTPNLLFSTTDSASTDVWNGVYRKDGWGSTFANSVSATSATMTNNGGASAEMFISASNLSASSAHYVRVETPLIGNAQIEHNSLSAVPKDFDISSMGQLTLVGAEGSGTPSNISCSTGGITLNANTSGQSINMSAGVGGITATSASVITCNTGAADANTAPYRINNAYIGNASNPMMTLTNSSADASSFPVIATSISGHNQTGTTTDYVYRQQHNARDATGSTITFGGIDVVSRNVGAGNQDGFLAFNCAVNGTLTKLLEINGNESEINAFQTIDLNGQNIKSSTGNMTVTTLSSTGTGTITISPKALGNLILTNIPSSSAGLPTGAIWRDAAQGGTLKMV